MTEPRNPVDTLCNHLKCNSSELARRCSLTRQAVNSWRTKGVPPRWAYQFIASSGGALTLGMLRPFDHIVDTRPSGE